MTSSMKKMIKKNEGLLYNQKMGQALRLLDEARTNMMALIEKTNEKGVRGIDLGDADHYFQVMKNLSDELSNSGEFSK